MNNFAPCYDEKDEFYEKWMFIIMFVGLICFLGWFVGIQIDITTPTTFEISNELTGLSGGLYFTHRYNEDIGYYSCISEVELSDEECLENHNERQGLQ